MSEVTNLVIQNSFVEDETSRAADLDLFFNYGRGFKVVSADFESVNDHKNKLGRNRWYGVEKLLETPIYLGAYNHLDLDGLVEHVKNIEWIEPENVQLIVQPQDSNKFEIIELK